MNIIETIAKLKVSYGTLNPFDICEKMNIKIIYKEMPENLLGDTVY